MKDDESKLGRLRKPQVDLFPLTTVLVFSEKLDAEQLLRQQTAEELLRELDEMLENKRET